MLLSQQGRDGTDSSSLPERKPDSHGPEEQSDSSKRLQHAEDTERKLTDDLRNLEAVNKQLCKRIERLQSSDAFTIRDQKIVRLEKETVRRKREVLLEKSASARAKALQVNSDEVATGLLGADERAQTAEADVLTLQTQLERAQKQVKLYEEARKVVKDERDEMEVEVERLGREVRVLEWR